MWYFIDSIIYYKYKSRAVYLLPFLNWKECKIETRTAFLTSVLMLSVCYYLLNNEITDGYRQVTTIKKPPSVI